MSVFASKYNRTLSPFSDVECKDFPFVERDEMLEHAGDTTYHVDGVYFHVGKFGKECAIIDTHNKCRYNAPSHMVATFEAICGDDEAVQAIRDGKIGISPRAYNDKQGAQRVTFDFIDL